MRAILALEDGRFFLGESFGATGSAVGEVCFNTSMTGYQEVLTDPSYRGQIVAMTAPQIGNYGVNDIDQESAQPHVRGFVIEELSAIASNWRSHGSLGDYLQRWKIPGIQGIDTRALVRLLRDKGNLNGVLSSVDLDPDRLVRKAREAPGMEGQDLVTRVTCDTAYDWQEGHWTLEGGYQAPSEPARYSVVAYDFGIKRNILRNLIQAGCRVRVVPASTPAAEVLAMRPSGVFLSNGPGDPAAVPYAADAVRGLVGKVPIFGICLGH